ncbi:MAG: biopolymer transporter ExbD [Bdellovibrionales bacterium]
MASAGATPSSGRRKSLDAELNLVPFIDLLSMCICFLLMTAVWMEIGGVNVKQLVGTDAPAQATNTYELDVKYLNPQTLEVNLKRQGLKNQVFKVEGPTNEARLDKLRESIKGFAGSLKLNPAATDFRAQMGQVISVGRVTTKAGVTYGEIVTVMDTLRDLGIVSLGLVPVRE